MVRRARHQLFVQCVPGSERLVEAELRRLGLHTGRRVRGGVEADGSTRQIYLANRQCRLATRILLRVGRFTADTFAALEAGTARIDWSPWVGDQHVVVRVGTSSSRLYHTDAIAERVAAAIGPGRGNTTQRIHVRLRDDRATLSVDTSGDALHHRGWRAGGAKAPLRPTIAAALLVAAGYDGRGPLIDPFCGSGTIPIEAARMAAHLPPGVGRQFAFQHWPTFEPGTWASVAAATAPEPAAVVVASDRDAGAVATTVANARRAEVTIDVSERSLSAVVNPGSDRGWLITNPPYGKRIRTGDVRDLYARLGQVARAELAGWTVALLTNDIVAAGHAGLCLEPALSLSNGGIAVHALVGRVPPAD